MKTDAMSCIVYILTLTQMLVAEDVTIKETIIIDPLRAKFFDTWEDTQQGFDSGDVDAGVVAARKVCEQAKKLKLHDDFQKEQAAVLRSLEKLSRLRENERKILREVAQLRIDASAPEASNQEGARLMKMAIAKYRRINDDKDDALVLQMEGELLLFECQSLDAKSLAEDVNLISRSLDSLEKHCVNCLGDVSFVHANMVVARIKFFQSRGDWIKAANLARSNAAIYEQVLPASRFHIQTLEDWGSSLAIAKRYKEAKPILAKSCEYIEAIDRYKYQDLGVTAYLLAGETAYLDGDLPEAEKHLDKAQQIVNALREGKISKKLILELDGCHISCLEKLGKQEQAQALRTRSKMRF